MFYRHVVFLASVAQQAAITEQLWTFVIGVEVGVVLLDQFYFMQGSKDHRHTFVDVSWLNFHDALRAGRSSAASLLDGKR